MHKIYAIALQCLNWAKIQSKKMGVAVLLIPILLGIVVIISALASFSFIFWSLKINGIIKKLLLFATVQQAIGFGINVSCIVLYASGFKNKLTCFLAITSARASVTGTQTSISAISIIRYSFTGFISCVQRGVTTFS